MKLGQVFLATTIRECYTDLSKVKHSHPNLVKALTFAKWCHEKYLANVFLEGEELFKKKLHESRRRRKFKTLEVRESIFGWFINEFNL